MDELPRPGDVVGTKYRIEAVLGAGGMGVVMGAADLSLGRGVAIKFLSPQKLARDGARERFMREARAAAGLQSEHVVRVHEVGSLPNGAPYIVMERLQGADLAHVLKGRGALRIDEAVDWVLQACEAIGEAHAHGIVHRDLKPQNLFLTSRADGSPCVKVLDFGISKATSDEQANLTSTDMVMGTPLYMSPEQVRSLKSVDHRADIWALGVILFELLTGAPVFEAPSVSALCAMIASDPPVPLRARRADAPAELEQIILRCLHKDPMGRFHDVAELAEALAAFASPRGRESALRVSRVVRAASAPQVVVAGSASAWSAPTAMGTSTAPTHQGWNRPFAAPPPAPTASGGRAGLVVAIVGGAILLLLLVGGGIAAFLLRSARGGASQPAAIASAAPPVPVTTASAPPSASGSATPPAPHPTATTSARPAAAHDAGTPHEPKDAGSAADEEASKRLAAINRQQCDYHRQQMTTFARTDADRKRAAEQAKLFMCRSMSSTRCERDVCMQACGILNDGRCLQDMQYVIDHGPKPPY